MKSLFTKVFATGFVATSALLANGQVSADQNIDDAVFGKKMEVTGEELRLFTYDAMSKHGKLEVSEWYSYINALTENGEAYTYFTGNSIANDSNAVQIFDGDGTPTKSHIGVFGVGQVFDPKSEHYALIPQTPPLSRHNAYTVDSLQFFFKYFNANPGSVDTVTIQFFNNDDVAPLVWQSNQGRSAAPTYDPATNSSPDATNEIKIPISESTENFYSTSINSFSGVMAVATGLGETNRNGLTAFTIKFTHGMSYSFGDTIVNDSLIQGKTKVNSFMPLLIRQGTAASPAFLQDTTMSHGVFAFVNQRYNNGEWYFPYNPPGVVDRQHIYAAFKLASDNVGVEELTSNGYGLGNAYPNPAGSNSEVNIPFTLGEQEDVTIEVVDLVGKSVGSVSASLPAGEHTEVFSTANLNQGIYLYTITAGDFTATKKFTIK
ncbi:MAG: T9SS type A sorting domain-containing protein [Bacteroidia bacterium]|nr:T9SS type A sorting domain-containing protein [Bacteroidia bacterium]